MAQAHSPQVRSNNIRYIITYITASMVIEQGKNTGREHNAVTILRGSF